MNIGDVLYFAPELRFDELSWGGPGIVDDLAARLEGFFFGPAERLCAEGHAFASGLIVLSALESLCRLAQRVPRHQTTGGADYREFCLLRLNGLSEEDAASLWRDFRCGLVHECRIKRAGQFSLEAQSSVDMVGPVRRVNPEVLLHELRAVFADLLNEIRKDPNGPAALEEWMREIFAEDLAL